MRNKVFLYIFMLILVICFSGCERQETTYRESPRKIDVSINLIQPTDDEPHGSIVEVEYPEGLLRIPLEYYRRGTVSSGYALTDLYLVWPTMIGVRLPDDFDYFSVEAVRLFVTFEAEYGTWFRRDGYYQKLQQEIINDQVLLQRASPFYPGLMEYWVHAGLVTETPSFTESQRWNIYYMAEHEYATPENFPLTFLCQFRGVMESRAKKNDDKCHMQWNVDDSMSITFEFESLVISDWQSLYRGVMQFMNEIRVKIG